MHTSTQTQNLAMSNLNFPNQITIARLVISLFLFIAVPLGFFQVGLILFVLAAGTDWLDGYIARKYNLVTQLGRILDPFADKILICGIFIFLAAETESGIAAWMAVVVVGRELLVTALRSFLEEKGADFSAKMAGKLKMVFQCVAAIASLWLLHVLQTSEPPTWLPIFVAVSAWIAVLSTLYSGAGYVITASKMLK